MREEVWAIVRAAVEEAMGPLVARQRELEARIERAERERDAERTGRARAAPGQAAPQPAPPQAQAAPPAVAQSAGGGGSSAASRLASIGPVGGPSSIPVAFGPSFAPPAIVAVAAPSVPRFEAAPGSVTNPGMPTIPDLKVPSSHQKHQGAGAGARSSAHPVGPRPSLPPQGYGVTVMTASRPSLDLESVGPIDISGFDGGRRKRRVAGAVVVLMVLLIAGAVTMAVLSHG